jgi:hypothetical protein
VALLSYGSALLERVPALLALVLLRSAPFVGYLVVSRSARWSLRVGAAGAVAVVAVAVHRVRPDALSDLVAAPLLFAYLAAGAVFIHWLGPRLGRVAVRRGALLLIAALLFVVAPSVCLHRPGVTVLVVLGWEMTLSAHSYGVDTVGRGARATLGEGLFFLLVNPTVVYRESGSREGSPGVGWEAALRIAGGTLAILGRDAVLLATTRVPSLRVIDLSEVQGIGGYVQFCALQLLMGAGLYCAHSGLASVQIGWMRLLGYRIPERYVFPYLAVSPQDFWQRWNTWIGRWAHHYLFVPFGHAAVRRRGGRSGPVAGVVAAFLGVGLLHDFGVWGIGAHRQQGVSLKFAVIFLLFAIVLVGWRSAVRTTGPWLGAPSRAGTFARNFLARAACLQVVCVFCWLTVPVLRGDRWPPGLERAFHPASSQLAYGIR